MTGPAERVRQRQEAEYDRYEAYREWERKQTIDPRFASTRMLMDDLYAHGEVLPETWERFDVEELTWTAEVLDAPSSHIDRFEFDGRDVIVKESDGVNPRITLRDVYQKGLDKTRAEALTKPGLAFQLRRDELFMEFYEQIERMMRGELDCDTIHMISTCPRPGELPMEHEDAVRLLESKLYNLKQLKSFDYTARRLPDGQLELGATRLDSSDLAAHAKVLQEYGYDNVSFALLTSHEFGRFLSYDNTTDSPIEPVIARRASIYDQELARRTGQRYKYGRVDDKPDAQTFLQNHCDDYRAGYKAYNELLAKHLTGWPLDASLQNYLLKCLDGQERAGQSVLDDEGLNRLRIQLQHGKVTPDMAMSCRELLVYDHHATMSGLYRQFCETGQVDQLQYTDGGDFMDSYADAASANGASAAANGETFAGCETATGVNSLSSSQESLGAAAQLAAVAGVTLEEALRMQEEEAMHCLNIQLYGYTIRRGVSCPYCEQKVDARDSESFIECLSNDCGKILNKVTGQVTTRQRLSEALSGEEEAELNQPSIGSVKLQSGQVYQIGGQKYRREQQVVVGGAEAYYVGPAGRIVEGDEAERLESAITSSLISAETRAA